MYRDWPSTRWQLSAPESYAVLEGAQARGAEAFKLSLMELVAREALVLDESAAPRSVSAVRDGARASRPSERALAATWDLYLQAARNARSDGAPAVMVADLARAAARHYRSLQRYLTLEVLPALEERGLFEVREVRVLVFFHTTRHVLTSDGEAARDALQQWLDAGRARFAGWTGTDTAQAVAFAGGAGAALLLMPSLFPDLRRLRERLVQTTTDDDVSDTSSVSVTYGGLGNFGDAAPGFGGIDFCNLDSSVFDGFEACVSAIDSAVEAGGGGDSGSAGDGGGGSDSGGSSDSGGGGSDSGGSSDSGSSSSDSGGG